MDFQLVTSTLLQEFEKQDINYAIIGGFALGFWGVTRATIDMDLLLLIDDAPRAEAILSKFAYRVVHKSENVAQYVSDLAPYGNIDILFAFRTISRSMLARSVSVRISSDVSIKSLQPEDIIGLKLQALVNDPTREAKDYPDIEALLLAKQNRHEDIDWELLEEYFGLFDKLETLKELKRKYDNAK